MTYDKTPLDLPGRTAFLIAHPHWRLRGEQLSRTFTFESFLAAVDFVNQVAALAEACDHHPDIDIRYREVRLSLTTHAAKALTSRDTALAACIDALL